MAVGNFFLSLTLFQWRSPRHGPIVWFFIQDARSGANALSKLFRPYARTADYRPSRFRGDAEGSKPHRILSVLRLGKFGVPVRPSSRPGHRIRPHTNRLHPRNAGQMSELQAGRAGKDAGRAAYAVGHGLNEFNGLNSLNSFNPWLIPEGLFLHHPERFSPLIPRFRFQGSQSDRFLFPHYPP
jgi:hypothetical protein